MFVLLDTDNTTHTMIADNDVCVLSYARTPIGSFGGKLKSFSATHLGSIAITGALSKARLDPNLVDEVFIGNVLSAGLGQAPARQAALGANIPTSVPCTTINKVCSSGMKAVALGASQIRLQQAHVVVVGGMESMTNTPFYSSSTRFGNRFGNVTLVDGLAKDGLEDAYSKDKMGNCAELCASELKYTRKEQDSYTAQSYARALTAHRSGKFDTEIIQVKLPKRRGAAAAEIMSSDEECFSRPTTEKTLGEMRTAGFTPPAGAEPTVTAGSSSTISDGAAALVLCSGAHARRTGVSVLAVIRGWGDAAKQPEWFTTAPSDAIPIALERAGLTMDDVDYFEINEAFSVVALANRDILRIDPSSLNVYGGAVSLGHPLGCSGARILCTLLSVLQNEDGRIGCAGICNGGGGASAMVVERVLKNPQQQQQQQQQQNKTSSRL